MRVVPPARPADRTVQVDPVKAKDDFKNARIGLAEFVQQMDRANAISDPAVYEAYKTTPNAYNLLTDKVALCRIIGANGTADDAKALMGLWSDIRIETREALTAAAENRGLREVMDDLVRRYERIRFPELRALVAHMTMYMGTEPDLPFVLEQLQKESDEQSLEYFARGVLRQCRVGGAPLITRIAELLKKEEYGQRSFYLAAVLRAIQPRTKIVLTPNAEAQKREAEVNVALALIFKAMESRPAGQR